MLTTLKTYSAQDHKFSFLISYTNGGEGGATLSVFAGKDAVTVDLTSEDLSALSSTVGEAHYASSSTLV
jgi:hypothetical protein